MILYYRERNGDYLAVDTAMNQYYLRNFGQDCFEGRATAIAGLIGSVCTTGISWAYLRQECRRVPRAKVPGRWRRALGLGGESQLARIGVPSAPCEDSGR